jgi:hypothetical protein
MEDIVKKYLEKYPNLPTLTLAKKIFKENSLYFKTVEQVRSKIRYYRGSKGSYCLKNLGDTKYLSEEKRNMKYNLPESIKQEYSPYKIVCNKALIFGDVHIPFHDVQAIETMFDYTVDMDIDTIIINGDFMDCFEISSFDKEPNVIRFKEERKLAKIFLQELKRIYPKAQIYYKFANHEARFQTYLIKKAPEIFDFDEFRLDVLLDLFNMGIKYIEEERFIIINGELKILHGHEYKKAVFSPANPARTTFLRTKANTLTNHFHQTSAHTEQTIDNKTLSCWSIGCLCELNPKYMPLNKHNHGFAIYTKFDDEFWTVENKIIIKGRVV